jgi:hypothetical protein
MISFNATLSSQGSALHEFDKIFPHHRLGGGDIGLEVARLLASRKHSLILLGRDAVRLQAASNEICVTHETEVYVHSVDPSEPG